MAKKKDVNISTQFCGAKESIASKILSAKWPRPPYKLELFKKKIFFLSNIYGIQCHFTKKKLLKTLIFFIKGHPRKPKPHEQFSENLLLHRLNRFASSLLLRHQIKTLSLWHTYTFMSSLKICCSTDRCPPRLPCSRLPTPFP